MHEDTIHSRDAGLFQATNYDIAAAVQEIFHEMVPLKVPGFTIDSSHEVSMAKSYDSSSLVISIESSYNRKTWLLKASQKKKPSNFFDIMVLIIITHVMK